MREQELQGNISLDAYTEVAKGYSVFESTKEFLEAWSKANASENLEISEQSTEKVAKICKVKICKNGNLFVGTYSEQDTKFVNFFLTPAEIIAVFPKGLVVAEYITTPQGRKVQSGWNWQPVEVLQAKLEGLQAVYVGDKILEVF